MAAALFTLPFAALPEGADPATFYGTFAGKLAAEQDGDAVRLWVASEDDIARVHALLKAATRFAPAGSTVGGTPLDTDTLLLQTWPGIYTELQSLLPSPVPAQVRIGNVDVAGVRAAVRDLYLALGKPETAVDSFMIGEGLLLVPVGTPIGTAAAGTAPPDAARPNSVRITAFDPQGQSVNVTQLFADGAALAGIDAALHPVLAAIPLEGWLDIVVIDEAGDPLAAEPYDLYLADGTTRSGTSDADGRITEAGLPPGQWGLDLPNHPSFAFIEPGV